MDSCHDMRIPSGKWIPEGILFVSWGCDGRRWRGIDEEVNVFQPLLCVESRAVPTHAYEVSMVEYLCARVVGVEALVEFLQYEPSLPQG